MWMAYSEACDTEKVVDLKSGVEKYQRQLERLEFDAEHEGIYGEGRFRTKEECLELADKYSEAYRACEQFLKGMMSLERMLLKQEKLNMLRYAMSYIEDFVPEELRAKFSDGEKSDSDVEICVVDDDDEGSDADVIIEHEEEDIARTQGYDEVDSSCQQQCQVDDADDDDDPITDAQGYVKEFYENPDAWTQWFPVVYR